MRVLAIVVVLLAIGCLRGANTSSLKEAKDFELHGVAVWQCQCPAYACPCQRNGTPVHGTCHSSDFAHIKTGRYGDVKLDGLNLVMIGDLVDANPDRMYATLYIDQKATPAQSDALTQIIKFMALSGEPPIPFNGTKIVPIRFHESADQTEYSVEIPAILEEKTLLQRNRSGQPHFSMPAMDLWSNVVHNADNVRFVYHDSALGKSWDHSGNYANIKYFGVTKKMYVEQKMLDQFGDNSGNWTPKQLQILREEGLKER
jgi:hypothetical protein